MLADEDCPSAESARTSDPASLEARRYPEHKLEGASLVLMKKDRIKFPCMSSHII